jgi:hypothetical protein
MDENTDCLSVRAGSRFPQDRNDGLFRRHETIGPGTEKPATVRSRWGI